jgi:Zn-dependent protease
MFFGAGIGGSLVYSLLSIIALVMALFVAMPVHEFAHAFAAKHEGDYTAVAHRRYTLAFLPHFDWKGFLFLVLFRFGWAKPVPIDERNFRRGKKSKFLVSIAGILANLILGALFLFIFCVILKINPNFFVDSHYGYLLYEFLNISVSLNFMLVIFNILPIYPFDGYKIAECFCRYDNKFLIFTKQYSIFIYILLAFSSIYYYYYTYTAGLLVTGLTKLFALILGL